MKSNAPLSLKGISKIRDERLILRNVSLDCQCGTLTLVLGANGAGKSTLLRIAAGLVRPDAGAVHMEEKLRMAVIAHHTYLYPNLTALDNLTFQARINKFNITRSEIMAWLDKAGLAAYAHEAVRIFSRGMAQRLNFCRALMLRPDILLLDEPFTGMDAHSQAAMRAELERMRRAGACILLVSHAPAADASIATGAVEIRKGRLEPCQC